MYCIILNISDEKKSEKMKKHIYTLQEIYKYSKVSYYISISQLKIQ